jgi:hypothetical protein
LNLVVEQQQSAVAAARWSCPYGEPLVWFMPDPIKSNDPIAEQTCENSSTLALLHSQQPTKDSNS